MAEQPRSPSDASFAELLVDESPDALIALTIDRRPGSGSGIEGRTRCSDTPRKRPLAGHLGEPARSRRRSCGGAGSPFETPFRAVSTSRKRLAATRMVPFSRWTYGEWSCRHSRRPASFAVEQEGRDEAQARRTGGQRGQVPRPAGGGARRRRHREPSRRHRARQRADREALRLRACELIGQPVETLVPSASARSIQVTARPSSPRRRCARWAPASSSTGCARTAASFQSRSA